MADKKISELNGVTLPLTGIEEIPIVQDGETKKVNSSEFISEFNNDSITVSVSTSYDIDWNASGNWDLTLTGNTVINQSNTPVLNKEKNYNYLCKR